MSEALVVGTTMIIVSVVISSLFISSAVIALNRYGEAFSRLPPVLRLTSSLTLLTLWLIAGLTVVIWMWAALLLWLGEFDVIRDALYFTSVTTTTLGYGDSLLSAQWQLLSGFIATNGLILFSLNTAFLFEALRRLDAAAQR